jgi:hypothetical protein
MQKVSASDTRNVGGHWFWFLMTAIRAISPPEGSGRRSTLSQPPGAVAMNYECPFGQAKSSDAGITS